MLPIQAVEELLSVSYVSAIIARSGFAPNPIMRDYGTDLEVREIGIDGAKRIDLGAILSLQLKATVNWEMNGTDVIYDLDADAYNRLVFQRENASTPSALILCCLPEDSADWLHVCEDDLRLRKCCYYFFIDGEQTTNTATQRIRIPRSQLLTPDALRQLKRDLYDGDST